MFTSLIVQPIFNVLSGIYAVLPGHDFGLAIIIFTILSRFALYPLLKKQLKNTKAMREIQPEIKKIKAASKGNKQQESIMMMELYKEREIKPLSQIGLMVVQMVVFIALISGLQRVVNNPRNIVDFSYRPIQNTVWMKEVSSDISKFNETAFGKIDLTKSAFKNNEVYLPALFLVLGSSVIQYFQIKQTMPQDKNAKKLRHILKGAGTSGDDAADLNMAMGQGLTKILPALIFFMTIGFPAALALYWFVGGLISYIQQAYLLKQDEYSMEKLSSAVVVSKKPLTKETEKPSKPTKNKKKAKTTSAKLKKRR